MAIENCKRCNRVFRKQLSPYCPECHQNQMLSFDKMYQYLQNHEFDHVHLHDIAENCSLPLKEVEDIFFSGRLGLAGTRVSYNCQMCDVPITPKNKGRRRLCAQCSVKMEIEGKLHIGTEDVPSEKEKKTVVRTNEEYQQALEQKMSQLKDVQEIAEPTSPPPQPAPSAGQQFGFKRLSM